MLNLANRMMDSNKPRCGHAVRIQQKQSFSHLTVLHNAFFSNLHKNFKSRIYPGQLNRMHVTHVSKNLRQGREYQMKHSWPDNKNVCRKMQIRCFRRMMLSDPNGHIWLFLSALLLNLRAQTMLNDGWIHVPMIVLMIRISLFTLDQFKSKSGL